MQLLRLIVGPDLSGSCRMRAQPAPGLAICMMPCHPHDASLPVPPPPCRSFRSDDYAMPLAGGGEDARPWLVRYRAHRRVR